LFEAILYEDKKIGLTTGTGSVAGGVVKGLVFFIRRNGAAAQRRSGSTGASKGICDMWYWIYRT